MDLAVRVSSEGVAGVNTELTALERKGAATEKSFSSSMKSMGASMTNAGKSMSTFVTLPLAGLGAGIVKLASDAEETANKFNVVFGSKNAGAMNAWIRDLRKIMPATTAEIQEMAATNQLMFEGMGLSSKEAMNMTKSVVTLAGDLGSLNNIPVAETQAMISAAFRGEYDSLQALVPSINAAAVEQKALSMGLAGSTDEISNQDKALAIHEILMNKTKAAQGDMARTADDTANSFKHLWADVREAGVAFGQHLLPILTPIALKLSGLVERFGNLSPTMRAVVLGVAAFAAAIGPVLVVVGTLISSFGALAGALGTTGLVATLGAAAAAAAPFVLAAAAIGAAALLIYRNWSRIVPLFNRVKAVAQDAFTRVASVLKRVLSPAFKFVQNQVQVVVNWWRNNLPLIQKTASTVFNAIKTVVKTVMNAIWTGTIKPIVTLIARFWKANWDTISKVLKAVWQIIKTTVSTFIKAVLGIIKATMQVITGDWKGAWTTIKNVLSMVWEAIKKNVKSAIEIVKAVIKQAWEHIKTITSAAWEAIKNYIGDKFQAARDRVGEIVQNLKSGLSGAWEAIKGAASSAWEAIKDAMTNPMETAWNILKGIWNNILNGVARVLDAVGLGGLAGEVRSATFATGGTTGGNTGGGMDNPNTPGVETYAKGGIGTKGKKPQINLWNEQQGHELFVPEKGISRQRGLGLLQHGAGWYDAMVVPKRDYRGTPTHGNKKGQRSWGRPGLGEGLGPTTYNWSPLMQSYKDRLDSAFPGTTRNTYVGHPGGEQNSMDNWGAGGRGAPVGGVGDAISGWIQRNVKELNWLIWKGQMLSANGWRPYNDPNDMHYDHVHFTAGSPGAGQVGGGFFQSLWDTVGKALWERLVQRPYDAATSGWGDGFVLKAGAKQAGQNVLDGIKAMIIEKSGVSGNHHHSKGKAGWPPKMSWNLRGGDDTVGYQAAADVAGLAEAGASPWRGLVRAGGGDARVVRADLSGTGAIARTWPSGLIEYGLNAKSTAAAHEFGHALGLGHGGDSIMGGAGRVTENDFAALKAYYGITPFSEGGFTRSPLLAQLHANEVILPLDNQNVHRTAQAALGTAELRAEIANLRRENGENARVLNSLVGALPAGIKESTIENLKSGRRHREAMAHAGRETVRFSEWREGRA